MLRDVGRPQHASKSCYVQSQYIKYKSAELGNVFVIFPGFSSTIKGRENEGSRDKCSNPLVPMGLTDNFGRRPSHPENIAVSSLFLPQSQEYALVRGATDFDVQHLFLLSQGAIFNF